MKILFSNLWEIFFPKCQAVTVTFTNPLATQDFRAFIDNILNIIFTVGLPLSVVMMLIGGILIVSAGGDQSQIEKGKKILFYTLVGLTLLFMARGLVELMDYLIR